LTTEFWVGPATAPDTYELVELLGGGGEGEVWRATLPLSAQGRSRVAVKILHATGAPDEQERWNEFGKLLRSLSHPGLVRVVDVFHGPGMHRRGDAGGQLQRYVVMDYVEGPTLREWTDEHPNATAAARLRMLRTAASALDEMHCGTTTEVAVAHGDVKPANIVVRDSGATVLVDLGLTRLIDAPGAVGRSTPYAAPELRGSGPQSTPAADRWAFAVTTAQVLLGLPPPVDRHGFLDLAALEAQLRASPVTQRRPTLVRRILDVLNAPPEARPSLLRPWLDGAADTLSQVTTPGPDDVATDPIADLSDDESAPTPVPGTPRHARPIARAAARPRRPLLAAVAVLAVLVVAAGVVAFSRSLSPTATATSAGPNATPAQPSPTTAAAGTAVGAPTTVDAPTPLPHAGPSDGVPGSSGGGGNRSGGAVVAQPSDVAAPALPANDPEPARAPAPTVARAPAPAVVPAASGPTTGFAFVIKGFGGKCLDVQGPSTADGTSVQMWDCNGATEMRWQVVGSEIHGYGGKCLDVRGPSTENGTPVQMWDCNGAAEMKWEVIGAEIRGFGGKCLDVRGPSTADGTAVQMWDCNGATEERWSIQRA
jgi:serine/threonine protein kinase